MEKKPGQYIEVTENDVKKMTLRFLKHYYRFKPRSVDAFMSADMKSRGGIVADGYLAFPRDDGQLFVATFEATSADTRHEVQFSVRREILNWDAWTFALLVIAAIRGWTHEISWFVLNDLGPWLWWGSLLISAFFLTLIFKILVKSLRRYRYIHAVEQFKQYHADDQWIAISDDVFPSTEHPYFKELRRQCINYGFGLILIDQHFHPHLHITPSKQDQFHNERSTLKFVTQRDWLKQVQDHRYVDFLREKLPWLFKAKDKKKQRIRFKRTHYQHLIILSCCLIVLGGIFYRQWEERLIDYQEQTDYTFARLKEMQENSLEPTIYLLDSAAIWPFKKNMRPYIGDIWETEASINNNSTIEREEDSRVDIIINLGDNEFGIYDCSRFFNIGGKKYLIQEGLYPDLELASSRMYALSERGVMAHTIWAGCFLSNQKGYIVYLDELYNSLQEASMQVEIIQDSLSKQEMILSLEIKVVYPNIEEK